MVNLLKSKYTHIVGLLTNIELVTISTPLLMVMVFQSFRFFLMPFMGLMPQEAYYHMYGQYLDWSYFDHPGMVGYLIRIFTELFGDTAISIKLMDFILTSSTLYFFYLLSKNLLPKKTAAMAVLLFCSSFMISVLSFNATPDVPLLLFWCGTLWSLEKAIFQNNKKYWMVSGIVMALAIQSKYTAVFLPVGMMLFLICDAKSRRYLKTPYPYIVSLFFLVGATPIIYWNYTHDFASFGFQTGNRINKIVQMNFKLEWLIGFFLVQALVILPVTFYYLGKHASLFWKQFLLKRRLPQGERLFLLAFFLPIFMIFTCISPVYWIKLNWMFPCYIAGIILVVDHIPKKHVMGQVLFASILHLLLATELLFYVIPIKSDDTWYGWEELSMKVNALTVQYPNDFVFSADNYKTTSILNFYLDNEIFGANVLGANGLQYNIIDSDLDMLSGQSAIYIDSDGRFQDTKMRDDGSPELLNRYFNGVEQLQPIVIYNRFGTAVRKFVVYRCFDYCPSPIE